MAEAMNDIDKLLEQPALPEWKDGPNWSHLYVTAEGKIVGRVRQHISSPETEAEANGDDLGLYYGEAAAMRAVEKAVNGERS